MRTSSYEDEFPFLKVQGLYVSAIRGDGNCLFNALSDQLFGSQDEHHMIRARTIEYMRENAEYYKMFMECHAGGGVRRNPKRKNAGGFSSFNASMPTPEEIDRVFESHLARMAEGGTWGDNMEIVAFSSAFDVDVKIYQRENAFMVRAAGEDVARPVCHIAYHVWEHYSSIRNLQGPHVGPPAVAPKDVSSEEMRSAQSTLDQVPTIDAHMMKIVRASLPHFVDDEVIAKTLKDCKGNINNAIDKLLDVDDERSNSSQQSSIDRDDESSDENPQTPSKRQDRRLSRATKSARKAKQDVNKQRIALKLETYGDSLDSLLNIHTPPPRSPQKRGSIVLDSDDESTCAEPLADGDTSSGSEYAVPTAPVPSITGIKLKLSTKPQVPTQVKHEGSSEPISSLEPKRTSARDTKIMKKQAQKNAAKERKQATFALNKKTAKSASDAAAPTTHPTMASGIRTLYI